MKNFRLNIIIRLIVLCVTVFGLFYVYFNTELTATLGIIFILIIIQIASLVAYVDFTNKELSRFLLSIKYSDFSQTFTTKGMGSSFEQLEYAFNQVMEKFKVTRSEKEESLRYLQTIMQHIDVGLISYDTSGKVEVINNAAKKLLGISYLTNMNDLNRISANLSQTLLKLKSGEKTTIKIVDNEELIQLIISATEFRMRGKDYTLISIQNIQTELEEKEMEAWQKLIRVLTHEIMNSVTPISSLAGTVHGMLAASNGDDGNVDKESIDDIRMAVNTIQKRSDGLIHFVNNYRNLTRIPKPNFAIFPVKDLFSGIRKLMEPNLAGTGIKFDMDVIPQTLEVTADYEMIEQVLLNILNNAVHALANTPQPEINMIAHINERGKVIIRVADNGPGISQDVQDKIFIPFFSTKKDGSGIGLSLSRQIVRAHGGNIRVTSVPGKETVFTLRF